ncbi:FAD binding domain-containing protein [Candidatus Xianfuyuplasma coldseepsis]|uniref:FAD-binding PCMH-type domain-containing protein n=1 Tax=Candidatus Xianfuyuplasma coldseepsis TaxID=2782163 RepID=A0A7L7KNS0_9MOLU|nr:FAD binding domain-containing protein [Xianfuyuplasma coldseepsis]QMS84401.1 hypothetical protein G4Z02_01135 [Xianfuyuplasma coldseepsis]
MVKHYLPTTLEEALSLLDTHSLDIIAGGTDLMVQRRRWANTVPDFEGTMNIMHIPKLQEIDVTNGVMHIGSTVSLTDIYAHPDTPQILHDAIAEIASPALRNLATIAGNIGNASPAGDTLPILYLLDAKIVVQSLHNKRILPIEAVITGPRKTTIQPNEIIVEIQVPLLSFTTHSFVKVGGRKADAISKLSFAAVTTIKHSIISDIRICFGAIAPTVVRSREIEQQLIGLTIPEVHHQLMTIKTQYNALIHPIDDQRSNQHYRRHVAMNLLEDYIQSL